MPYGLFDYMVKFFSKDKTNNLRCEKDYEEWQVTMYANFGTKWVSLHRGPAWEYEVEENEVAINQDKETEMPDPENLFPLTGDSSFQIIPTASTTTNTPDLLPWVPEPTKKKKI